MIQSVVCFYLKQNQKVIPWVAMGITDEIVLLVFTQMDEKYHNV